MGNIWFQNYPRRRIFSFRPFLNPWIQKRRSEQSCCSVVHEIIQYTRTYIQTLADVFIGFSLLSVRLRPIKGFSLPRFYSLQDANLNSSSNTTVPGERVWPDYARPRIHFFTRDSVERIADAESFGQSEGEGRLKISTSK